MSNERSVRALVASLVLWGYGTWYLVMVWFHFSWNGRVWSIAAGMSLCVGLAHHLNYVSGAKTATQGQPRWAMIWRFFLIPFCVASLSALLKGGEVFLVFPLEWRAYFGFFPCLIFWLCLCLLNRGFLTPPRSLIPKPLARLIPRSVPAFILSIYALYYLCLVIYFFQKSPHLWGHAFGLAIVVGVALNLNAGGSAAAAGPQGRPWTISRFYVIPFCVASFVLLSKDAGFYVVFSQKASENLVATATTVAVCLAAGLWSRWTRLTSRAA